MIVLPLLFCYFFVFYFVFDSFTLGVLQNTFYYMKFHVQIDVHNTTLGDVVTRVIKAKLGFNEPMIMMGSNFLYEEGDGADEDLKNNLQLKLSECPAGGIQDGAQLVIEDFTQNLEVT